MYAGVEANMFFLDRSTESGENHLPVLELETIDASIPARVYLVMKKGVLSILIII